MKSVKILCPTGHLSFTPLEKASFLAGCAQSPDYIVADAGSSDMGPRPLGADTHVSLEDWQRHDLEVMLVEARRLGVPMIVGSASDTGTNRGVDQFVRLIREIAAEHGLAPFNLAAIYSEVPVEELKRRRAAGAVIEGLDGRDPADEAILDRTTRAVAVMNAEPIVAALERGADVVIAGRSSDCALFAAALLHEGFSKAIAYYTGKLMECASFCAEPYMAKESIMGRVEGEAVHLTPMHPDQRCTPASIAGHSMYERNDPFTEHVAGGVVDMSSCIYEQVDERTTRASGAVFRADPVVKVKIEGAGMVGHRRLAVVGIRDPYTVGLIAEAIRWSQRKVEERFGPAGENYELYFHRYGDNGVMKDLEPPTNSQARELCVIVEALAPEPKQAEEIAALAARNLFYARLPQVKGTAGTAALMSDEILIGEPGYVWTLNHVLPVADATELFSTTLTTVDGTLAREAA